ncbi:MAG: Smr/MutS family protein [Chloroflexia bacterium]
MNEKSLNTLEFPKVRERLASYASFSASRELALALLPSNDISHVRRQQRITTEAVRLLSLRSDVTIGGARDVREIAGRAALGSLLDPTDILLVKITLAAARNLRNMVVNTADNRGGLDTLRFIADGITPLPKLEAEIERCINDEGAILDSASPKLASIRQGIRVAHSRLMSKLQQILGSETYSRALQEPIYTLRDGRYVVPVKRDFQGAVRGIVHDQSSSGSTLFVEPLAIVNLGNEWRQLQLEEYQEIERILRELGALIGAQADPIKTNVEIVADLDLALAKARYSLHLDATEPEIRDQGSGIRDQEKKKAAPANEAQPTTDNRQPITGSAALYFQNARHPLLTGKVVPITVELGGEFRILVITGPNTGGKTVALKTVGLLTLMAQAGLHIPADAGSRAHLFTDVFADIGDEQSIEQSLSTFSSHMSNIVGILKRADKTSLVLLDELGAGTDPQEGSALARAIITHLLEVGSMAVCTTHYSELKAFAFSTPGVENASVEFDINTLSPTYRLMIGVPGRSNALAIAQRLGLSHTVIGKARTFIDPHEQRVEDILEGIRREREEARKERGKAETARRDLQRRNEEMERHLSQADEMKARAEEEARLKVEQELDTLRAELRQLRARVEAGLHATSDETLSRQWVTQAQLRAEQLEKELRQKAQEGRKERHRTTHARHTEKVKAEEKPHTYGPGDLVFVQSLGMEGDILSVPDSSGQVEVQVGAFKTRVPVGNVTLRKAAAQVARDNAAAPSMVRYQPSVPKTPPPLEYDFRGWRAEAAIEEMDRRLDEAAVAGMPFLRVIHGKGTGALRKALREYFKGHPAIREVETAPIDQGGEGVTIVRL